MDPRRPPRATADCDPIPDPYASVLLGFAAKALQVDAKLLRGVIVEEWGFRPCAVSSKGARELMQLMPATAEPFPVNDAFDPKQNVNAGAKYLKQLLDKGDVALALAAYHAELTTADATGKVPDIKNRDYADAILKRVR